MQLPLLFFFIYTHYILAHDILIATKDRINYEQFWQTKYDTNDMVFQVKACSDAHIILSPEVGKTEEVYEIALGIKDNVNSVIRNAKGTNHVTVLTQGILSCDEYRTFWVQWVNGSGIYVGEGPEVGVDEVIRLIDRVDEDIKAPGFSTGNGATGSWRIQNYGGK